MDRRLARFFGVCLMLSLVSWPALSAQVHEIGPPPSQPIWATVNATATGNYPGGNELFTIFIVNSAQDPKINETIQNATLTAPFGSNFGPGLPSTVTPGQSLLLTIYLEIPLNFSQPTFNANLLIHATILNRTITKPITLTGVATVNVYSSGPSSSQGATTTAQSAGPGGSLSPTLFAAGVAIPSIVAIVLLVLLIRGRGPPK